jgi:hypothetical protein
MAMDIQNLHGLQAGIALSLMAMAGASSAQTYDPAVELAVRQAIPKPARCGGTIEPVFFCRFDAVAEASVALELSATKDGASASLTYTYGDPKSTELLAVVRDFFGSVGIDIKSFDRCVWRSHTVSGSMAIGDLTLRCQHTDFADRVTYEISAVRTPEAPPKNSDIALRFRSGE